MMFLVVGSIFPSLPFIAAAPIGGLAQQVDEQSQEQIEVDTVDVFSVEEDLQNRAARIAKEYGVSYEVMKNIIDNESKWDPNAIGDNGESCGLVQIHIPSHINEGITCEKAKDPEFALNYLAAALKSGDEWMWTSCSCVKYARALGVGVPRGFSADELKPNSSPVIGGLVLLRYGNVSHVAVITSFTDTGVVVREANFTKCKVSTREIDLNDQSIQGFWSN